MMHHSPNPVNAAIKSINIPALTNGFQDQADDGSINFKKVFLNRKKLLQGRGAHAVFDLDRAYSITLRVT